MGASVGRVKLGGGEGAELRALARGVEEMNRAADTEFLELSRSLKSLYGTASQLAGEIGAQATKVRESLEQGRMNGAEGAASQVLGELERNFGEVAGNLESLKATSEALRRLVGNGHAMERLATLLGVSGAGFAIESARTPACQEAFGDFVAELRSLAARIASLGGAIGGQARQARGELDGLIPAIAAQLQRLRQLTQQSETAVRQSWEEMQRLNEGARRILDGAEAHTRKIATHAEEAVFSLQSGDILRQKLEHVVEAVEEAAQAAGGAGAGQPGAILAVQTAQLEAVREELSEAGRQVSEAFSGIAAEVDALGETIARLEGGGRSGPFDELRESLMRLARLRGEGDEMLRQAGVSSQTAMEAASKLGSYLAQVQAINQQMQLQALNALIKTEHLGRDGQTLGVLSMHVHEIFQESCASVDQTVEVLEQVTVSTEGRRQDEEQGGGGESGLKEVLAMLGGVDGSLKETLTAAGPMMREQRERFEAVRARIESLVALDGRAGALAEECAGLRDRMGGAAVAVPVSGDERYTMESERLVHQRMSGQAAGPVEAVADSDDNVEFF